MISYPHKLRLMELAGLDYTNVITEDDVDPFPNSGQRVNFKPELMIQAIEHGMEVGLSYRSKDMPVNKFRKILPVAMGIDLRNGNLSVRGVHTGGQSESEARRTGKRSAEAQNEWRLFDTNKIAGMFFTGKYFDNVPIGGYNPNDSMLNVQVAFNPNVARKNRDNYERQQAQIQELRNKTKNVRSFFKKS